MATVNLTQAKAHLSALVDKAAAGEAIQILRRGRPVAQITATPAPRRPIDAGLLRSVTDTMSCQTESAGDFVRGIRDSERY